MDLSNYQSHYFIARFIIGARTIIIVQNIHAYNIYIYIDRYTRFGLLPANFSGTQWKTFFFFLRLRWNQHILLCTGAAYY